MRRTVGSREVMKEQLDQLLSAADRPNVKLQLLPLDSGAHVASSGPITVLRFADPAHGDVAFSDTPLGGHVIDDLRDVAELSRLFSALQKQALPRRDSKKLLSSIAEAYGEGAGP